MIDIKKYRGDVRSRSARNGTNDELDKYGRYVDPAEAYQQFMLSRFDVEEQARELCYSREVLARPHEARLVFMVEFKNKSSGYVNGHVIWDRLLPAR